MTGRRDCETYEIGDRCVDCGESTAFGSGRFVNRFGACVDVTTNRGEAVTVDGWRCEECHAVECDRCGGVSAEFGAGPDGGVWCDDCSEAAGWPLESESDAGEVPAERGTA